LHAGAKNVLAPASVVQTAHTSPIPAGTLTSARITFPKSIVAPFHSKDYTLHRILEFHLPNNASARTSPLLIIDPSPREPNIKRAA
jgi:hypothetical protein